MADSVLPYYDTYDVRVTLASVKLVTDALSYEVSWYMLENASLISDRLLSLYPPCCAVYWRSCSSACASMKWSCKDFQFLFYMSLKKLQYYMHCPVLMMSLYAMRTSCVSVNVSPAVTTQSAHSFRRPVRILSSSYGLYVYPRQFSLVALYME